MVSRDCRGSLELVKPRRGGFAQRSDCLPQSHTMNIPMEETVSWQRLLREALAVLAAEPNEQVRLTLPGCVSCELLEDFDHARRVAMTYAGTALSHEQLTSLDQIRDALKAMNGPDVDCIDNQVVHRLAWQKIRILAKRSLRAFNWEGTAVLPYEEIEPRVWKRPDINQWMVQGN